MRTDVGAGTGPDAAGLVTPPSMIVPGPGRSRVPIAVAALVLVTGGYLVMLATTPGGADVVVLLSDVTTVAAAVAASVACALAGRRHARSMRAFWWLLAAACGAWAVGESIWTWYEVVLRVQVPYPSWADISYLVGTPLAVAAFACHPAASSRHRRRVIPLLDGIAVASALLFVSWTLVLGPLWDDTGMSVGDLVAVAYPFADVVILVLIVLALRNLQPGNRPATAMLLGGLLVMAFSDTGFTYLSQSDSYSSGDLIDAGWFASYLAIAAAAMLYESPVDARPRALPSRLISVLAAQLPILVALGAIPIQISRGAQLDRVEWGIALCLTVVVLARTLLDLLERRSASPPPTRPSSRPAPSGRHQAGSAPRASVSGPALPGPRTGAQGGVPASTMAELHALTLEMAAAARPSAPERVQHASGSMIKVLTSMAGVLALWDFTLLLRGAG